MDEKETKQEEQPTEDTGDRSKPEVYKSIDDANLAAKRMEEANKEKKELLDREEDLLAKRALGGRAEAGQQTPEEKKKTDLEIAEAVEKGELNPLKEDGFV